MKLTRKQIREALDTVPIEAVLLGTVEGKETRLSVKDREFARQIALGESKAAAYRKSRPSKGKPVTQSRRGQELMKRSSVQAQVDAYRAAFEAQKYTTPANLRALAIHQLTQHALNEDCPPAQRIKALELIGKMTEVALFTERREIVQTTDAAQIKDRLMATLRSVVQANATDVDIDADSLLAELEPRPVDTISSSDDAGEPAQAAETEAGEGSNQAEAGEATPTPPRRERLSGPPPCLVFRTSDAPL
jgi:hypothetical protein